MSTSVSGGEHNNSTSTHRKSKMKRDTSEDLSDAMDSRWQDRKEAIGTIRGSRGGIEPLEYSD